MSAMMGSIAKVDKDGLGVTDMKESVRLRRESSDNFAFCEREVRFLKFGVDLRVFSWFV